MDIEIPATKGRMLLLADYLEKLKKLGVDVKIVLSSEKFLGWSDGKEFDAPRNVMVITPEEELVKTMWEMAPVIFLWGQLTVDSSGNEKWKKAAIEVMDEAKVVRATCPFCGKEDEYNVTLANYAAPHYCTGCGARTFSITDFDDFHDVEFLENKEDRVVMYDGKTVHVALNVTFAGVGIPEEEVLKETDFFNSHLMTPEEDGDIDLSEVETWLVFSKEVEEVDEEDLKAMVEKVAIKKVPLKAAFRYEVKTPSKAGKGKAVYVPREWAGDVMVIPVGVRHQ